jgi:hypothetical protein
MTPFDLKRDSLVKEWNGTCGSWGEMKVLQMIRASTLAMGMVIAVALGASSASAASIVFTGITAESGTGFGHILNLLSLRPGGRTTFESGSVLWDGSQDILLGDARNTSQTQTASTLLANDITAATFGLVLNINEASEKTVTLRGFALRFLDAAGGTLFDADFVPSGGSLTLEQAAGGSGSAGWVFSVHLSSAEEASFYGDPNNRIGMIVSDAITGVSGGPENFFVASAPAPEPSTFVLTVAGLTALAAWARRPTSRS